MPNRSASRTERWLLAGTTDPTAEDISKIDPAELSAEILTRATNVVFGEYARLGATDQVAKGPELKKAVRTEADLEILIG